MLQDPLSRCVWPLLHTWECRQRWTACCPPRR